MISVYCETKRCLFILNVPYIFTGFADLSSHFYGVGVVDSDLTKFQECVFVHARNTTCKIFEITF